MGHSGAVECGDGGHRRAVGASAKTVRCRDVSPAIRHGMPPLGLLPTSSGFSPAPSRHLHHGSGRQHRTGCCRIFFEPIIKDGGKRHLPIPILLRQSEHPFHGRCRPVFPRNRLRDLGAELFRGRVSSHLLPAGNQTRVSLPARWKSNFGKLRRSIFHRWVPFQEPRFHRHRRGASGCFRPQAVKTRLPCPPGAGLQEHPPPTSDGNILLPGEGQGSGGQSGHRLRWT